MVPAAQTFVGNDNLILEIPQTFTCDRHHESDSLLHYLAGSKPLLRMAA
jgi:hypothetical protein